MNEEFDYPVEDDDKVILSDEDGKEIECTLLATIEYEGAEYVVFLPDDDNQCVILRVIEKGDDEAETVYESVEDMDILEKVFNIFQEMCGDEVEFVDP